MKLFRYVFEAFTAPCEVTIRHEKEAVAASVSAAILREAKRLEATYSYFRQDSAIGRINSRSGESVGVDDETAFLIAQALRLAKATGYVFDAAVGTFKAAWQRGESIEPLRAAAGEGAFWLEGKTLCFRSPLTRLDFGGLVKEYALDQAGRICRKHGVRHALINFGGDLLILGQKNKTEPWRSAIVDPATGKPRWEVALKEGALATSGHYERFTTVNGRKFSHIIPPSGCASLLLSATVAHPSALDAGAYATALMAGARVVLPPAASALLVEEGGQIRPLGRWLQDYGCKEVSS